MREADDKIIHLLSNQAFTMPLSPEEEQKVRLFLSFSMFEQKDRENFLHRKKTTIANGNGDTLDSLLVKSSEARARRIVLKSSLSPKTLPVLVELNPLIATECLYLILSPFYADSTLSSKEKQISDSLTISENDKNAYLTALTSMDMSLHSMEVVNRLATLPAPTASERNENKPLLHPEFLQLYLSNCIASCENIHDSHHQTRLVRLVCVFLQSLIQSNVINFGDLLVEIQAFCVHFSKIREASTLFKFIKSLESN
jgi:hypothetical protein